MLKMRLSITVETKIDVFYRFAAGGCSVNGKFIFGENYIDRSVADLAAMARHPRTQVYTMSVSDADRYEREERTTRTADKIVFIRAFETNFADCPLIIYGVYLWLKLSQQGQMRMLALIRPEKCDFLMLQSIDDAQDTDQIVASEHWKYAREVLMMNFSNLPARSLVMFPRWEVHGMTITREDARVFVIVSEKISDYHHRYKEIGINR